jgi:hypothetical protein
MGIILQKLRGTAFAGREILRFVRHASDSGGTGGARAAILRGASQSGAGAAVHKEPVPGAYRRRGLRVVASVLIVAMACRPRQS